MLHQDVIRKFITSYLTAYNAGEGAVKKYVRRIMADWHNDRPK